MDSQKWSDEYLAALRQIGDAPADAAVSNVNLRGSIEEVSLFLTNLIQNDTSILGPRSTVAIPPEITAFIAANSALPSWADPNKLLVGQRLFMRHGPAALASLLCASLPECYSHEKGSKVLWYTQNLEDHTVRRVYQTARIILDVMRPNGLSENGPGVLSSVKTRLLHAAMRHLILTKPSPKAAAVLVEPPPPVNLAEELLRSDWREDEWGKPINMEDSVFTLLTFSYVILRSWERLGCAVSDEERVAYLHCWNLVGYFLGIPQEHLPTTYEAAEIAFTRLQEHQQASSPEGAALTKALQSVIRKIVPDQQLASHIDHTLMRYLMSDKTADIIGVPPPDPVDHLVTLGLHLWRIVNEGLSALEIIFKEAASHSPLALTPPEAPIPVLIGRALTEFLVAMVGRGEHGFDIKEIEAKASQMAKEAGKAAEPIKEELAPLLKADSSITSKYGAAQALGYCVVKVLVGSAPEPTVPATPPAHGPVLGAPPPTRGPVLGAPPPATSGPGTGEPPTEGAPPPRPPGIPPPRRPYVLPPEFAAWAVAR